MIHATDARRTFRALDVRARDPSVSLAARGIWRIIDSYADAHGLGAYPSLTTIARHAILSTRQVRRLIDELSAAGWLEEIHIPGRSSSYVIFYGSAPSPARKKKRLTPDTHVRTTPDTHVRLPNTSDPEGRRARNGASVHG